MIIKINKYLSHIVYGNFEILKNDYAFLLQEFEKLSDELKSVSESNLNLKALMNKDHDNSSISSSKEHFPKKIKPVVKKQI